MPSRRQNPLQRNSDLARAADNTRSAFLRLEQWWEEDFDDPQPVRDGMRRLLKAAIPLLMVLPVKHLASAVAHIFQYVFGFASSLDLRFTREAVDARHRRFKAEFKRKANNGAYKDHWTAAKNDFVAAFNGLLALICSPFTALSGFLSMFEGLIRVLVGPERYDGQMTHRINRLIRAPSVPGDETFKAISRRIRSNLDLEL